MINYLLINFYLKSKLKSINNDMKENVNKINFNNFIKLMKQLNAIYMEIIEYNDIFWSKYLCLLWFTMSSILALFIHIIIFVETYFIFTVAMISLFACFALIFILCLSMSSQLYNECFSVYNVLNSQQILINRFQIRLKIKVIMI